MAVDQTTVNNLLTSVKNFFYKVASSYSVRANNSLDNSKNISDVNRLKVLIYILKRYNVDKGYFSNDFILFIEREYKHLCGDKFFSKRDFIYSVSNFQLNDRTSSSITLSWEYNNKPNTLYIVEISFDNVNWSVLYTGSTKFITATGLAHNTLYYFRLKVQENKAFSDYVVLSERTLHNTPASFIANSLSSTVINLSWSDNNSGESAYKIEISTDDINWTELITTIPDVIFYQVTGLVETSLYYFRIQALNTLFNNPSEYAETTELTLLNAPTMLVGNSYDTEVNLSWIDNSSAETGYVIEISIDGVNWTENSTVGADITVKNITGLNVGDQYYFRVKAVNLLTESLYSNEIDLIVTLSIPVFTSAIVLNDTTNQLIWEDTSLVETGFEIQRSEDGVSGWTTIHTTGPNIETYNDDIS